MELSVRVMLLLHCASLFGTAEQELNLLVLEPIPNPPLRSCMRMAFNVSETLYNSSSHRVKWRVML